MNKTLYFFVAAAALSLSGCGSVHYEGLHLEAIPGSEADAGAVKFHQAFYDAVFYSRDARIFPSGEGKIWFEKGAAFYPRDKNNTAGLLEKAWKAAALIDPTNTGRFKTVDRDGPLPRTFITFPPEKCGAAIIFGSAFQGIIFAFQDGATGDCAAMTQKLKYFKNYSSAKNNRNYFKDRYDEDLPFCDAVPKAKKTYLIKESPDLDLLRPRRDDYKTGYCFSREYEVYKYYWLPGKKSN
jgi:hypothetical protein